MLQNYQQQTRTSPLPILTAILIVLGLISALFAATRSARAEDLPPVTPAQADQPLAPVSSVLAAQLDQSTTSLSFFVILEDQLDAQQILRTEGVDAAGYTTRAATLYRQLSEQALRTQAPLRAWLDARQISYTPFYIVNMIEVRGDSSVADALRRLPAVERLEANPQVQNVLTVETAKPWLSEFHFPKFAPSPVATPLAATQAMPYGLSFTKADQVWAMGYRGQGIVVASQDTGVQWDHPAFKPAYRGTLTDTITGTTTVSHTYNWYDAVNGANRPPDCDSNAAVPCDDDGHGTHTVGTMVGDATVLSDTVLGMAPAAQWIGCRNMNNGIGTPALYTTCFEFMLAPYPQGGDKFTEGRPELAPQVINNSWGCPPSEGCDVNSLRQIVETMRAAGIMVVSSAGNSGSVCFSVATPIAIHDATFTVGAHSSSGEIASFSSRGPVSVDGSFRRKPDISAPGVSVRSTGFFSDVNTFKSGTSMASPHVAGAVALLYSAAPWLIGNPDLTEQVLIKSASAVPDMQCPVSQVGDSPNNVYGFGRLDVLAAVEMAQHPASVAITLENCAGEAASNVQVQLIDPQTAFAYSQTTTVSGTVVFSPVVAANVAATLGISLSSYISDTALYELQISGGDLINVTLPAELCAPRATLALTVTLQDNSPLDQATVHLIHKASQLEVEQETSASGQITFANLLAGEYVLNVENNLSCGSFSTTNLSLTAGESFEFTYAAAGTCDYYLPLVAK